MGGGGEFEMRRKGGGAEQMKIKQQGLKKVTEERREELGQSQG